MGIEGFGSKDRLGETSETPEVGRRAGKGRGSGGSGAGEDGGGGTLGRDARMAFGFLV